MSILCTFPGRAGDLLWALPTVRGISESAGQPVDLLIAGEFQGMVPLLEQQPYLARVVADPAWGMDHGWQPPNREDVINPYEQTYHLGYRRWPELGLPHETYANLVDHYGKMPEVDLHRPWITGVDPPALVNYATAVGFSDCHLELKVGLLTLLGKRFRRHHRGYVLCPAGSRWETEYDVTPTPWLEAASVISGAQVFLGCCSALHVLAVAMGKPVVCYEPMEGRWNPIFYPVGQDGPQVTLVRGNDGRPTFDARHTGDVLALVLARVRP